MWGEPLRLMVSWPPRHGKSEEVAHWTPLWFLKNWPDRRVILASYEAKIAARWGRRVRNDILQFPDELGLQLTGDSTAADRWELTTGGGMLTAGVGGPITGEGAHLLIIDDPTKNAEEANSPVYRDRLVEWFKTTAFTRLEPGGSVILDMTRWHQADLIGALLEEMTEPWEHIRLPALAEPDDPLGREEGEALWPDRYSADELLKIKETVGPQVWAGLYQQRPAPAEGGVFRYEWWGRYREVPELSRKVQFWDTAFKKGADNDYSVCTTLGVAGNSFPVLDVWRRRVEFPELLRAAVAQFDKHRPNEVLVEDAASGQDLFATLRRETRIPIKAVKVDRDKISRANAVTGYVEAGRVPLPERAAWVADFMDELAAFPNAAHDDQVDSFAGALTAVVSRGKPNVRFI